VTCEWTGGMPKDAEIRFTNATARALRENRTGLMAENCADHAQRRRDFVFLRYTTTWLTNAFHC